MVSLIVSKVCTYKKSSAKWKKNYCVLRDSNLSSNYHTKQLFLREVIFLKLDRFNYFFIYLGNIQENILSRFFYKYIKDGNLT